MAMVVVTRVFEGEAAVAQASRAIDSIEFLALELSSVRASGTWKIRKTEAMPANTLVFLTRSGARPMDDSKVLFRTTSSSVVTVIFYARGESVAALPTNNVLDAANGR